MRLLISWNVRSPRVDRLLAAGGLHRGGSLGRQVQHDAGAAGEQVWLSCACYSARLGGALTHLKRWQLPDAAGIVALLAAKNAGGERDQSAT